MMESSKRNAIVISGVVLSTIGFGILAGCSAKPGSKNPPDQPTAQEAVGSPSSSPMLEEERKAATRAIGAVARYYLVEKKFPASNQEAGLPPPGTRLVASVRSASVAQRGIITLILEDGPYTDTVVLIPDPTDNPEIIHWRCTVTTDRQGTFEMLYPDCTSAPGAAR